MRFIGMRELSNNTKNVISIVKETNKAIITDNGKPTAILLNVSEDNFEEMLDLVQKLEMQLYLKQIQKESIKNFPNGMSMDEIDEEIKKSRIEKKRL